MKQVFTILATVLLTATVFAQSPEKMSYQGVIRDASNNLVTSQSVGMQISILQDSATGTSVYVETQTLTTNANGLVSVEIGDGTVQSGDFTTIDWANGPYFIKTETDPTGGTSYSITGTNQLLSVPYALHAKTAENATGTITETDLADSIAQVRSEIPTAISDLTMDANSQNITNLSDPVNAQDAATKAYVDELEAKVTAMEDMLIDAGLYTFTDADGNSYNVVKIGEQVWMDENLKTTKYNDGSPIPLVTDNTAWGNLSTPGYCWYDNDSATNAPTYGAIYNWYTVETGNLCPSGWHVPTDAEWTTLTDYLGGTSIAGGKLKETGTTHWNTPNTGATNENDFTALPGGYRSTIGSFININNYGNWWSATENSATYAWYREISYDETEVGRYTEEKDVGFSVRCLRD